MPGVLLLDTMGELARIYSLAGAVFVGGSLAPRGGHNIIEPAGAGAAIVVGPHMQNFASITNDFLEDGAIVQIGDVRIWSQRFAGLLLIRHLAQTLGSRARAWCRDRRVFRLVSSTISYRLTCSAVSKSRERSSFAGPSCRAWLCSGKPEAYSSGGGRNAFPHPSRPCKFP